MSRLVSTNIFIMLLATSVHSTAGAKPTEPGIGAAVRLFQESGLIESDYDQKIADLITHFTSNTTPAAPVDLQLGGGISYRASGYLGGNQHVILSIGEGRVLRLRRWRKRWTGFEWSEDGPGYNSAVTPDSMKQYRRGYELLTKSGAPVVKILSSPATDPRFIVSEDVAPLFSYESYLRIEVRPRLQVLLDHHGMSIRKVDEDLLQFVARTAKFSSIGDFRGDQLMYTATRGWLLLDWHDQDMRPFRPGKEIGNIFVQNARDDARNGRRFGSGLRVEKPGLPPWLAEPMLRVIERQRCELILIGI